MIVYDRSQYTAESPVLQVRDLTIGFPQGADVRPAVREVSFTLARGEGLAVVGESGCGKTTLARALVGLLPPAARVLSGSIEWDGTDLLRRGPADWRRVRGAGIAMIFQEPGRALNPLRRAGDQVAEAVRAHSRLPRAEARRRAQQAMAAAAVPDPEYTARLYPHQLSGGLQQRVAVAVALAGRPSVLVADEPTTALDATVQRQVLDLLAHLRQELRLGLLFITHDLALVAQVAQRLLVMQGGAVVEQGDTRPVLQHPQHPYTRELVAAWRT